MIIIHYLNFIPKKIMCILFLHIVYHTIPFTLDCNFLMFLKSDFKLKVSFPNTLCHMHVLYSTQRFPLEATDFFNDRLPIRSNFHLVTWTQILWIYFMIPFYIKNNHCITLSDGGGGPLSCIKERTLDSCLYWRVPIMVHNSFCFIGWLFKNCAPFWRQQTSDFFAHKLYLEKYNTVWPMAFVHTCAISSIFSPSWV